MSIPPFAIEAAHPRNANLKLQSIPGKILRSRLNPQAGVYDPLLGGEVAPTDQTLGMAGCPVVPGQILAVDPGECVYKIRDPLAGDEVLQGRLVHFLKTKTPYRVERIDGEETPTSTLDKDRIKTLCRECIWLVEAGEAKVAHGALPDLEDVNELDGEYLLNPGLTVQTGQPRYEKDYEEWVSKIQSAPT